ncbi:bifunctional diaminohydroxyphosphoribosylaminopyrimidine deaminase/5-amino-6-(5-phosphoribosylamino)uracil reductase RibD [Rubrobacter calidifluminis]|uniref:bifunctional diaminohydroxyphosphoribosylaminopyrimidine deaminase/5-amino-6-(5-phosphoribosylamino)uracil reductase RibD n=1 Tax=Rubrobacter calidifluminis TaxID=1392640 RepID=UPI00235F1E12|nr:bifunctional diaminohydroxyphosphoribosylaminopyrimidine deaminase/5-amino-6-(5-phosphoribosylamino)uracil reductase RibD [Rubrobacter calidifluminis]
MQRARDLAERGRYTVAPNPLVGCVVVRDGRIVGEGWHERAGSHHAEAVALDAAGEDARGATLYVTLEPCNRRSRSSEVSCTGRILEAGVKKVVIGHIDPNPRMNGRSVRLLRDAGVEVEVLDDPEFGRQNEQWFWYKRTGRPFVHLKLAVSLDGRIACAGGDSRWVTGPEARRRAHLLRAEAGAVLVGIGTVLADDPLLTVRDVPGEVPAAKRVVLDARLRIPLESALVRSAGKTPLIVFAAEGAPSGKTLALQERGVRVVEAPLIDGIFDPGFVLDELGRLGVRGVLVEGGGETAAHFVRRSLVNKMTVFYAPKLVGSDGRPMVGELGVAGMAHALPFTVSEVERLGDDVAVTFYPRGR